MVSDLEWAVIAAWIDTEGCIDYTSRGSSRVRISQKDPGPLRWIQARVGGRLNQEKRGQWSLRWAAQQTIPLLEGTLPHYLLKGDRARAALKHQKNKRTYRRRKT